MLNKFLAAGVAAATLAGVATTAYAGKELDAIKARGQLLCGVSTGVAGFGVCRTARASGRGLDVDLCRAVAAAIFGDADKVKFIPAIGPGALHGAAVGRGRSARPQHDLDDDARHRARLRLHRRQLL